MGVADPGWRLAVNRFGRKFVRVQRVVSLVAAALLSGLIAPGTSHSQATHIVADPQTSPARWTATVVTPPIAHSRLTQISGGTVAGKNLFHSFTTFSLAAGDTAQWVYLNPQGVAPAKGGAGIANVISRVTGGDVSSISGSLVLNTTPGDATALPNANFFFINPAGIVFGAGAQINVPRAAYFSTAQELRFGPGEMVFSAADPNSTFSMADPASFGFFGSIADLTVANQSLNNGAGNLSLSAANLTLTSPSIHAGNIGLFAVGSQAFDLPVSGILTAGSAPSGTLKIAGGNVIATPSATTRGDVLIGAGDLQNSGLISALGRQIDAGDITITATTSVENLPGAGINADAAVSGNAGTITITTGNLSNLYNPKQINITPAFIAAESNGSGQAGQININATTITNSGNITVHTQGSCLASCVGGSINIVGGALINNGGIKAGTNSQADGGEIIITTISSVENLAQGIIHSPTSGGGAAGAIIITTNNLMNDRGGDISTSSDSANSGAAGTVSVQASRVENDGTIQSDTNGTSRAGDIIIITTGAAAGCATNCVTNTGTISSTAQSGSSGPAGSILISTDSLTNEVGANSGQSPAVISSSAVAGSSGVAGSVIIAANQITNGDGTAQGGSIMTSGYNGSNAAPSMGQRVPGQLTITDVKDDGAGFLENSGTISSATLGSANAGNISIAVTTVNNLGAIVSDTSAGGNAGQVSISTSPAGATTDGVTNTGTISSTALAGSTGNAGSIAVTSNTLMNRRHGTIQSASTGGIGGAQGQVSIAAASIVNAGIISINTDSDCSPNCQIGNLPSSIIISGGDLTNSGRIRAATTGVAAAGGVNIMVDTLENLSGGTIQSQTKAQGAAGTVSIVANLVTNQQFGTITTLADTGSSGAAGQVSIQAAGLWNDGSINSNTYGAGPAGGVTIITAGNAAGCVTNCVTNTGKIVSTAQPGSGGDAGSVTIFTDVLTNQPGADATLNPGSINSSAFTNSSGAAGDIFIDALQLNNNGMITTVSYYQAIKRVTGHTGEICINCDAGGRIGDIANGGLISASTFGFHDGGTVNVNGVTISNNGNIESDTFGHGSAGGVNIVATNVSNFGRVSSNTGSVTDTTTVGAAGKVNVQAADINNAGTISTDTFDNGAAGDVVIATIGTAASCATNCVTNTGTISSTSQAGSTAAAGNIQITTDTLKNFAPGVISSSAEVGSAGEAGSISITAAAIFNGAVTVAQVPSSPTVDPESGDVVATQQGGSIKTDAYNGGQSTGGQIVLRGRSGGDLSASCAMMTTSCLTNTGAISATTSGSASAGTVKISAVSVINTGTITTAATAGTGDAGDITLMTNTLIDANGGKITSNAEPGSSGNAGSVTISNDPSTIQSPLEISQDNYRSLASSLAATNNITIEGEGSEISSASKNTGSPGRVVTDANQVYIMNGGQIDTDTSSGVAGDIYLLFKPGLTFPTSVLSLGGNASLGPTPPTDIGTITTRSSGTSQASSGGKIYVYAPYALIQTGSLIQATGGSPNAQVFLSAGADLASTDKFNSIDVSGLYVNSGIVDLSGAGKVESPTFVDSEKVLKGQCPSQAVQGETSRLINELKGPYGGSFERAALEAGGPTPSPRRSACGW